MRNAIALLMLAAGLLVSGQLSALIFTVTKTADTNDGLCDADCSLREAIVAANATAGADDIRFNIGSGVQTINPTSLLPPVTDPVTIDGTTQPGFAGSPLIELSGAGLSSGIGLDITAGSSTVRGLVINRFTFIAIRLMTGGGNTIQGNFIGTNVAGTATAPTTGEAVVIFNSPNNLIGGATVSARNLISGTSGRGIEIEGAGSTGNLVQGNYIGTDVTGSVDLGNNTAGVHIESASNNTIGGITATPGTPPGNVISGNNNEGIRIADFASTGNVIQGNLIGTNAAGTAVLSNHEGVTTFGDGTIIGGTAAGAGNVISGNDLGGIRILSTTGTIVQARRRG